MVANSENATGGDGDPIVIVPLFARKTASLVGSLGYRSVALAGEQKRFAGRYALRPNISLDKFEARAVIDWLELKLLLSRKTQFQWIAKEASAVLGRKPWVRRVGGGLPNDPDTAFEMRIQEPKMSKVIELVEALRKKFGFEIDPVIFSIEISVDFRPKQPDDLDRTRLLYVLANHLLVDRDVLSDLMSRPRSVTDRSSFYVSHMLYGSRRFDRDTNNHFLRSHERDIAPYVDGTYELGARNSAVRWRIMDKIIDSQNVAAGTSLSLPEEEKRVRIEVTLYRPEIAELGVTFLDDLKELNFTRMQGRFFRFFLPTFDRGEASGFRSRGARTEWLEMQRIIKFTKTGSIGLKAMDDILREDRKELRRRVSGDLKARGLKPRSPSRRGVGPYGTFVAYKEMNDRLRMALRKLGDRVAADF